MVRFFTYWPLERERHADGRALGDGLGVSCDDLGEAGSVRALGLHLNHVLSVRETHAEKDPAVRVLVRVLEAADGARAAE